MNSIMRRVLRLLAHIAQWIVFAFIAFVCVDLGAGISKFLNEGIDASVHVAAIVALALVAIGLLPPLFFRLPGKARVAAHALGLAAFMAVFGTLGDVDEAYVRTPKGAAEARERAARAASRVELEAQMRQLEASVAESEEYDREVATTRRQVQRCINWRGQVPSLVRQVKEDLHNPGSFEHVETTVAETAFPLVLMRYRAENGFGALRTSLVTAVIVPEDCSVKRMTDHGSGQSYEE